MGVADDGDDLLIVDEPSTEAAAGQKVGVRQGGSMVDHVCLGAAPRNGDCQPTHHAGALLGCLQAALHSLLTDTQDLMAPVPLDAREATPSWDGGACTAGQSGAWRWRLPARWRRALLLQRWAGAAGAAA